MNSITNEDLEITLNTLILLLEWTNEHEPYATSYIDALDSLIEEIPRDKDEL